MILDIFCKAELDSMGFIKTPDWLMEFGWYEFRWKWQPVRGKNFNILEFWSGNKSPRNSV
jgi:hypothetical protein